MTEAVSTWLLDNPAHVHYSECKEYLATLRDPSVRKRAETALQVVGVMDLPRKTDWHYFKVPTYPLDGSPSGGWCASVSVATTWRAMPHCSATAVIEILPDGSVRARSSGGECTLFS